MQNAHSSTKIMSSPDRLREQLDAIFKPDSTPVADGGWIQPDTGVAPWSAPVPTSRPTPWRTPSFPPSIVPAPQQRRLPTVWPIQAPNCDVSPSTASLHKMVAELAARAEEASTIVGARHCLRKAFDLGSPEAVLRVWSVLDEKGLTADIFKGGCSETLASAAFSPAPASTLEMASRFGLRVNFQIASLMLASAVVRTWAPLGSTQQHACITGLIELFLAGADPKDSTTCSFLRQVSVDLEQKACSNYEAGLLNQHLGKPSEVGKKAKSL